MENISRIGGEKHAKTKRRVHAPGRSAEDAYSNWQRGYGSARAVRGIRGQLWCHLPDAAGAADEALETRESLQGIGDPGRGYRADDRGRG